MCFLFEGISLQRFSLGNLFIYFRHLVVPISFLCITVSLKDVCVFVLSFSVVAFSLCLRQLFN